MEAVPRGGAEVTTIARVAQEAGVGVGTVSRVINGSASVSEGTRRRVLEVIDELGYEPNATARALSTGQTYAVGVIAPFFTEPSVTERLRGVSQHLAGAGYQLILFDLERPEQRDQAFRSQIGRVDGVLSISLAPTAEELERLAAADVPLVLVDQSHESLPTVTIDDVEGGRLATEHLIALGHERIAFAGDQEDAAYGFSASALRRAGYEQALAAAGLEPCAELQRLGGHGRAAGADTARRLLDRPEPPTAIFATSDLTALGVLEAAEAAGVRVPEDLSVVGFDDIEVARYAGLTTIAQPLRESGAAGVELLLETLAGAPVPSRRLPLRLVVRATTAAARTGRSFAVSKSAAGSAAAQWSRMT
jgi:DNA-binding LacI/PurR family transcriptional regulator